jgi:hypothetical protein
MFFNRSPIADMIEPAEGRDDFFIVGNHDHCGLESLGHIVEESDDGQGALAVEWGGGFIGDPGLPCASSCRALLRAQDIPNEKIGQRLRSSHSEKTDRRRDAMGDALEPPAFQCAHYRR